MLIHGYRPQIVALDIIFLFQFAFILFLAYFRFRSVLPNLQASSGKIGEALRAPTVLALYRNIIGATLHPALEGEVERLRGAPQQAKRGEFIAPIKGFRGFFFIRCTPPTGGVRIAAPIVLAQYKGNERIGEVRRGVRASPTVCYRNRLLISLY